MDKYRLNGTAFVDGKIKPVAFISSERDSETQDELGYRMEFVLACVRRGWEPVEFMEMEFV